jgi:hypothetical protein
MCELIYLNGVGRIEHMWMWLHTAVDQEGLDPVVLRKLAVASLQEMILISYIAARIGGLAKVQDAGVNKQDF